MSEDWRKFSPVVFPNPDLTRCADRDGRVEFLIYSITPQHIEAKELGRLKVAGASWNRYLSVMGQAELRDFLAVSDACERNAVSISSSIFEKINSRPRVPRSMAIVNVTPDSFYPGSRVGSGSFSMIDAVLDQEPDIIDIGGESTRPGSERVTPQEEYNRIRPILEYVSDTSSIPVSVDTRNPETARMISGYRVTYLNDISGFRDPGMIRVAADHSLKPIVMHMKGDPATMQLDTSYEDLFFEINQFLLDRASALIESGIGQEDIVVDPGIGFGKSAEQNMEIVRNFHAFTTGFHTLAGTSRKSFIGAITGSNVNGRLPGTIASSVFLMMKNVDILRVHDVRENVEAMKTYLSLLG